MVDAYQSDEFRRVLYESALLLRQNQAAEAVSRLLPLYAAAPANADVALNLGGAYVMQRKWDKAVRVLSKAAELHPEHAMIWTNLAAAYLGRLEVAGPRQQERAIRAYQRALAADPQAPNVHYHLGLIYKERGDLAQAAAYFQQAVAVNPLDADARGWLLWIERQQNAAHAAPEGRDTAGDTP